jgi:hypothetical protein
MRNVCYCSYNHYTDKPDILVDPTENFTGQDSSTQSAPTDEAREQELKAELGLRHFELLGTKFQTTMVLML